MLFKVIVFILILGLIILNLIYRREIKSISEQVDFINKHDTNKIIVQNTNIKEIKILVEQFNELMAVHRNITKEYKIKDEALKQTMTNISHDIRTPLTSLNGYFQLLVETENIEERERYTSIIQTRIDSLKNLLEDMFTYMKIQDNSYEFQEEECNLSKIVQDSLFSYYEVFNSREIEPIINIPEETINIRGNTVALDRIVNNLINNSLIHGKNYIGIILSKGKNGVNLIIENDIGKGQEIDLENIFTRFYKRDEARSVNSTGLGLTIVKELVEAMDGKITASIEDNIFSIKISLCKD